MANYFGIDFGTTNSAVVWYQREPHFQQFVNIGDYDNNPYSSVVAVDSLTQSVQSGRRVKEQIIRLREGGAHLVVESIKSALDTDQVWHTPAKTWDAESVARELFRALSAKTNEVTGEPIRRAVVSIPVGMTPEKRAVLRGAARGAGIEVASFISEPTAAFIAHAKALRHCRYAVVFDWGGGTLDVSVLESRGGCISERHTDGSHKAGDYIDERVAEWLHTRVAAERGLNLSFDNVDPMERQILLNQAEQIKCRLQEEGVAQNKVLLGRYAGQSLVELTVRKDELDALVSPVVNEALDLLQRCVRESHISEEEVGKLIVVGGSSKLRLLRRELTRRWPRPNVIFPPDADWDIARGAAWLAAHPGGHRIAEGVGLILADGEFHPIFPSGTQLEDAQFDLGFGLVEDSPTAVFDFASRNGAEGPPRHIGKLQMRCFGFRDEVIELGTRITEDLVFEAEARNPQTNSERAVFTYEKLRWMYEAPEQEL